MPMFLPDARTTGLAFSRGRSGMVLALYDLARLRPLPETGEAVVAAARAALLAAMECHLETTRDGLPFMMVKQVRAFRDGCGPTLYHLAMARAPLSCDDSSVSDDALAVWDRFRADGNVHFHMAAPSHRPDHRPERLRGCWTLPPSLEAEWGATAKACEAALAALLATSPWTVGDLLDVAEDRMWMLETEPLRLPGEALLHLAEALDRRDLLELLTDEAVDDLNQAVGRTAETGADRRDVPAAVRALLDGYEDAVEPLVCEADAIDDAVRDAAKARLNGLDRARARVERLIADHPSLLAEALAPRPGGPRPF